MPKTLINKYQKLITNEKGSAIVLVALAMTVFLGMVSLVTDTGLIFVSKARLVNAVDAAVLAGAQNYLTGRIQRHKLLKIMRQSTGLKILRWKS